MPSRMGVGLPGLISCFIHFTLHAGFLHATREGFVGAEEHARAVTGFAPDRHGVQICLRFALPIVQLACIFYSSYFFFH